MKYFKPITLVAFYAMVCLFVNAQASKNIDVVQTKSGAVSGAVNMDGSIHVFKGIPFAAPPLGDLRWKAPQPVQPWTGVKQCSGFWSKPYAGIAGAIQYVERRVSNTKEPISEDCLYLNVWSGAIFQRKKAGAGMDIWRRLYQWRQRRAHLRWRGNGEERNCVCKPQLPGRYLWIFCPSCNSPKNRPIMRPAIMD